MTNEEYLNVSPLLAEIKDLKPDIHITHRNGMYEIHKWAEVWGVDVDPVEACKKALAAIKEARSA